MHIYSFNDLKFTLKYLKRSYMFRSYDHPQGAYIVPCKIYSLKNTQWLTSLRWVGVVAACLVYCVSLILFRCDPQRSLTLYVAQRTSITRLMLPQHQLTQYTRHAATAPTHTIHKTCCHCTKSHNTQDILPQHQLTQYTRHAATAPTHTIHKTCCHSTNSHNTHDMLPQHQLTQYTRHAATAPTHTIHTTCCHSTNSM